jgi:hypothetical protein
MRGFDPSAEATPTADVLRTFLCALGVPDREVPSDYEARVALYRSLIAGRRILVVLDNVRDSAHIRPLLPTTPGSAAIITSRDPLTGLVVHEGALAVPLGLLSQQEATSFLRRRLGSNRLAGDTAAAQQVIELCGGLPLALALFAARAAAHPQFKLRHLAEELVAPRVGPPLGELTRVNLATEVEPGRFHIHDLVRAYSEELLADRESPAAPAERDPGCGGSQSVPLARGSQYTECPGRGGARGVRRIRAGLDHSARRTAQFFQDGGCPAEGLPGGPAPASMSSARMSARTGLHGRVRGAALRLSVKATAGRAEDPRRAPRGWPGSARRVAAWRGYGPTPPRRRTRAWPARSCRRGAPP